ncbi:MAG: acetyl-CoA carboxylase biotin carboxyl carrier protein [Pseudomonadota bacterium]
MPASKKDAKVAIDTKLIRELAEMLADTDLNEIEVSLDEFHVRLARGTMTTAAPAAPAPVALPAPAIAAAPAAPASAAVAEETPAAGKGEAVPAPMVGTAYLAPSPGASPFVKAGDKVKKGETLMIIEAMKTMNQIAAPRDGTVESIAVEDGQPVEFGEALVMLS